MQLSSRDVITTQDAPEKHIYTTSTVGIYNYQTLQHPQTTEKLSNKNGNTSASSSIYSSYNDAFNCVCNTAPN